jgi:hypothetical protein
MLKEKDLKTFFRWSLRLNLRFINTTDFKPATFSSTPLKNSSTIIIITDATIPTTGTAITATITRQPNIIKMATTFITRPRDDMFIDVIISDIDTAIMGMDMTGDIIHEGKDRGTIAIMVMISAMAMTVGISTVMTTSMDTIDTDIRKAIIITVIINTIAEDPTNNSRICSGYTSVII